MVRIGSKQPMRCGSAARNPNVAPSRRGNRQPAHPACRHRCKSMTVMGLQSHPRVPVPHWCIPVGDRLDDNGNFAKWSAAPRARTMPSTRTPWRAYLGATVKGEPIRIRLDPQTRGLVMRRKAQQTRAVKARRLPRRLASCAGWRSNSCRRNPNETRSRQYRAIFARLPDIERRA
jgi:hypothetical protein